MRRGEGALYDVAVAGFKANLSDVLAAIALCQLDKVEEHEAGLVVIGTHRHGGLLDWFRDRLVAERMINPEDLDLVQVIDEPEEVVAAIFKHYESRGFTPLPEEHELMLNL